MIKLLISKLPDESSCLELVERFEPLLKKYAALIDQEDAFEDLRCFFIELVNKMKFKEVANKSEGHIVNYIATSVYNHYIYLSKCSRFSPTLFSELSEEQMAFIDYISAYEFDATLSEYFTGNTGLKDREIRILYMYYVQQYSVKEIADHFKISRQAVNQSKLRAVEKIKKALMK